MRGHLMYPAIAATVVYTATVATLRYKTRRNRHRTPPPADTRMVVVVSGRVADRLMGTAPWTEGT